MWFFLLAVVLFILVIGSVTDIKYREVPDWLSYSGIVVGLCSRLIWSVYWWDSSYFVEGIAGFAVFFIIACALYYLGQWGGGDSKVLMAIGACLGLSLDYEHIILAFVVNMIWIGGVYGLFWSVFWAYRKWDKFKKEFRSQLQSHGFFRVVPLALLFVLALLSLVVSVNPVFKVLIIFSAVFIPLLYYLSVFVRVVEKVAMYKLVSPGELTEGDWIARDIKVNNEHVCGPGDLGISAKQIRQLKKLNVKKVLIKVGIPFVPALLAAFLFTLFLGNPLFWLA